MTSYFNDGYGHVLEFPDSADEMLAILDDMANKNFFSLNTKLISLEMVLGNLDNRCFITFRGFLEISASGTILPTSNVHFSVLTQKHYNSPSENFRLACEVLFVLLWLRRIILEEIPNITTQWNVNLIKDGNIPTVWKVFFFFFFINP
jgi:hypothetical protein